MSVGFQDQVQKLRSILKDAASDGFARVQEVSNLGVVLHKQAELIVDRYSTALEEYEGEVRTWCGALGSFDEAGFPARSLIVARGLRLCQALVGREPEFVRAEGVEEEKQQEAMLSLPGIGPKTRARLVERGFTSVDDLLWHLPRRYDDSRSYLQLEQLEEEHEENQKNDKEAKTVAAAEAQHKKDKLGNRR